MMCKPDFERSDWIGFVWRIVIGVLAVAAAMLVQTVFFDAIPHVTDETSHWFQAKLLAGGRLSADLPPCPEHFYQHNVAMTKDGRWFSKYPPGHAAYLAIGMKFGRTRWMVPLSSGFLILALMGLVRRYADEITARWTGVLWVVSPQVLLLASSYMSHMTCLAGIVVGSYFLWKAWYGDSVRSTVVWGLGAGFMWMWAVAIRPQDGALAAMWVGLAMLWFARPWGRWLALVPLLSLGALPWAYFFLYRNQTLFGSPWVMGYYLPEDLLVFPLIKDTFGINASHTWNRAFMYTAWSLYRLNFSLLGWPVSFLLVPLAFFDKSTRRQNLWLIAGCVGIVIFYMFHSYYGFEYEARYYTNAIPLLLVLSACGLVWIWRAGFIRDSRIRRLLRGALIIICAASFSYAGLRYWPDILWPRYGNAYEQVTPEIEKMVKRARLSHALVLISSSDINSEFEYSSGFIYNDPDLLSSVLYARDTGSGYECLRAHFPQRMFYKAVREDKVWRLTRWERE